MEPHVSQVLEDNLGPLGIDVKVKPFELFTLLRKANTRGEPWDFAWLPQGTGYPDSAGIFVRLLPRLRGTRYEARINAANQLTNTAARAKAFAKLEADLMLNDPPIATYADFTPLAFISTRFGCWGADANLDLEAVCKK